MSGRPWSSRLSAYRPGTRVRSHYRARWTGVVVSTEPDPGYVACYGAQTAAECLLVRPTHTVDGRPIRKAKARRLNCSWLEIVAEGGGGGDGR
jgi:hypothetical protein